MTAKPSHLPGIFDIAPAITSNHLFYGDNLTIMRHLPASGVDLIYLDPPFNSQRNYNLIYKKLTGQPVPEQEEAFCDAWEMDPEKEEMVRKMPIVFRDYGADDDLIQFWQAWISALRHTQPRLLAYLVYMSFRLFEMRRILKSTGSVYLHCDPTASHYIKVIMDGVFGHQNFGTEIIWNRTFAKGLSTRLLPNNHDIILLYHKSKNWKWNPDAMVQKYDLGNLDPKTAKKYSHLDANGRRYRLDNLTNPNHNRPNLTYEFMGMTKVWRWTKERMQAAYDAGMVIQPSPGTVPSFKRYLDEQRGKPLGNIWMDIPPINSQAEERLGYPTQKPIALLQRIIELSTDPGDVVFDPFCGCGTAVYAAHLTGRKWIGCDIAILSVRLVRDVLLKRYGLKEGEHYKVDGVPRSVEAAHELFDHDPRQFQHWAVELAGGFASTKHTGDKGIDGRIHFDTKQGLRNMVLSVKGGNLSPTYVRDLRGVMDREKDSEMAGFICLQSPTKGMLEEAASAGAWNYLGHDYHRLQIRTIQDLLDGKAFDTPSRVEVLSWAKQGVLPL